MKKIIAIWFIFAAPAHAGFMGGVDRNKVNLTTDQTVCGNKTFCSDHTIFNGNIGVSTTAIPSESLVVDGNGIITGWLSVGGTIISTTPYVETDPIWASEKSGYASTTTLALYGLLAGTQTFTGENTFSRIMRDTLTPSGPNYKRFDEFSIDGPLIDFRAHNLDFKGYGWEAIQDGAVALETFALDNSFLAAGTYAVAVTTPVAAGTDVSTLGLLQGFVIVPSTDGSGPKMGVNTFAPTETIEAVGNIKATAFYGDGSNLTGISAGGDVYKASTQTFTGQNTFSNAGNVFYGNGSNLTGLPVQFSYPYTSPDGYMEIGVLGPYTRNEIHFSSPTATLRLGAAGNDGDGFYSTSEGIVLYGSKIGTTAATLARIKPDRFALSDTDDIYAHYRFLADRTGFYAANMTANKVFQVVLASSQTIVTGSLKYVDGLQASGKVLTSDGSGIASWQTPAATYTPAFETVTSTCAAATTCSATCSGLKVATGGGCSTGTTTYIADADFNGGNGYTCNTTVNTTIYARVRCANP